MRVRLQREQRAATGHMLRDSRLAPTAAPARALHMRAEGYAGSVKVDRVPSGRQRIGSCPAVRPSWPGRSRLADALEPTPHRDSGSRRAEPFPQIIPDPLWACGHAAEPAGGHEPPDLSRGGAGRPAGRTGYLRHRGTQEWPAPKPDREYCPENHQRLDPLSALPRPVDIPPVAPAAEF